MFGCIRWWRQINTPRHMCPSDMHDLVLLNESQLIPSWCFICVCCVGGSTLVVTCSPGNSYITIAFSLFGAALLCCQKQMLFTRVLYTHFLCCSLNVCVCLSAPSFLPFVIGHLPTESQGLVCRSTLSAIQVCDQLIFVIVAFELLIVARHA